MHWAHPRPGSSDDFGLSRPVIHAYSQVTTLDSLTWRLGRPRLVAPTGLDSPKPLGRGSVPRPVRIGSGRRTEPPPTTGPIRPSRPGSSVGTHCPLPMSHASVTRSRPEAGQDEACWEGETVDSRSHRR